MPDDVALKALEAEAAVIAPFGTTAGMVPSVQKGFVELGKFKRKFVRPIVPAALKGRERQLTMQAAA